MQVKKVLKIWVFQTLEASRIWMTRSFWTKRCCWTHQSFTRIIFKSENGEMSISVNNVRNFFLSNRLRSRVRSFFKLLDNIFPVKLFQPRSKKNFQRNWRHQDSLHYFSSQILWVEKWYIVYSKWRNFHAKNYAFQKMAHL